MVVFKKLVVAAKPCNMQRDGNLTMHFLYRPTQVLFACFNSNIMILCIGGVHSANQKHANISLTYKACGKFKCKVVKI